MKAFVLLVALTVNAFADSDYEPISGLQVIHDEEGETLGVRAGGISMWGCNEIRLSISTGDVTFTILESKWQHRADENDDWSDIPDTAIEGVCQLPYPTVAGDYRWVAHIALEDDSTLMVATENVVTVAGESPPPAETAVKPVTWGRLKSAM